MRSVWVNHEPPVVENLLAVFFSEDAGAGVSRGQVVARDAIEHPVGHPESVAPRGGAFVLAVVPLVAEVRDVLHCDRRDHEAVECRRLGCLIEQCRREH